MVGAGTIRIDDPLLTVRPHATRRKPYARVVVCETDADPGREPGPRAAGRRAAGRLPPHDRARPGRRARASSPRSKRGPRWSTSAPQDARELDLARRAGRAARARHRDRAVRGRPDAGRPAARRAAWCSARSGWSRRASCAPSDAVPVLAGADLAGANGWRFDRIERARRRCAPLRGPDRMFSGLIVHDGRVAVARGRRSRAA